MDLGQGIMGVSDKLLQIEKDKRTREETINAVRSINDFNMKAQQEWVRVTSEEDISSTESVRKYHMFLQEQAAKTLSEFPGGEESRGRLAVQLEQDRGNHALSSYNQGVALQKKVVGEYAEGVIGRISAQAALAPSDIDAHFAALDKELGALSPALTPEQESAYYRMGRSQVVVRSATAYMDVNNFEGANAVLSAKGITEIMDPDTLRQLRSRMTLGALAQRKQKETLATKGAEIESFIGRPLTDTEKLKVVGLNPTASGRQSLAEKVGELQSLGVEVTADMVKKMQGAYIGEGSAGTMLERSIDTLSNTADVIEAGVASPEDVKDFKKAWALYTKEQRYQDELGRVVTVTMPIPDYIKRAATSIGLNRTEAGDEVKDIATASTSGESDGQIPVEQTIFGMNKQGTLTGPVAVGATVLGKTPVIGDIMEGGGDYTSNQQYVKTVTRDLVRVLQNNPKYAIAEMESISKELTLLGQVFDTGSAYEQRLVGLHRALTERAQDAAKTSVEDVDVEVRNQARNVYNGIVQFLPKLGVPKSPKNPEELRKWISSGVVKPGDWISLPDGSIRRVMGSE